MGGFARPHLVRLARSPSIPAGPSCGTHGTRADEGAALASAGLHGSTSDTRRRESADGADRCHHDGHGARSWAGDTAVFLGVPYAAPPVGRDRFGPPKRHPHWEGTRDAGAFGATAPQATQEFSLIPEPVVAGDDYLNLNVFTPDPGSAGLPVLVWIHGGGFFSGCSANPWYSGERFARDGVVLVSINYRLGPEGFLRLKDEGGNRAVLDWVAALEWIRDNVGAFGGDPANVTIAGQSAGATACETLITIPSRADSSVVSSA